LVGSFWLPQSILIAIQQSKFLRWRLKPIFSRHSYDDWKFLIANNLVIETFFWLPMIVVFNH